MASEIELPVLERDASPAVRLLDALTIDQIAAGEVIERPASVVKELVENALDAGADRIEVELSEAGRRMVRVADNGHGMGPTDLELCVQRHATSKIRSSEDLSRVATLGFRGEALPSIASVSRLTIASAPEDGLRHRLKVEGGHVHALEAGAGSRGTEVTVEDLFFNTPARLKFLKSDSSELSACVEVVSRMALASPGVSFRLIHNGNELLATSGKGDLLAAIAEVWGRDLARALTPVCFAAGGIEVRGFVSPPHVTKPTRSHQWLYVNGRAIRSRALTAALDLAYRSLSPERRHAVVLLGLRVPPADVDVNVSPTKSEVRFRSEGLVFDAVRHSVSSALLEHGMIPSASAIATANEALDGARPEQLRMVRGATFGSSEAPACGSLSGAEGSWAVRVALSLACGAPLAHGPDGPGVREGGGSSEAAADALASSGEHAPRMAEFLEGLRVIGQAMGTFVLAENAMGILIVDQHVAHERILYERIRDARSRGGIARQRLLSPEPFEVDARSAERVRQRLDDLAAVGFDLEEFGKSAFLVRSVPAGIGRQRPLTLLRDLVDEMGDAPGLSRPSPAADAVWISCACKMAIKAGDVLAQAEMERLLLDLAETENPYFCPHGRPITLVLHRGDLLRKFKRC